MIIKNAPDSVKSNKQRYSFFTPLELKTLNHCAVDMPLLNPFHKNAIMRLQSQLGRFSRTLIGLPVSHWLGWLSNQKQLENRGSRRETKWRLRFSTCNSNKRSSMHRKIASWSLSKKFWIIERLGRIISPRQKSRQRSRQPNRRYFELEINVKNGIFLIYSVVLQEPFQIDALSLLSDWLTSSN